MTEPIEITIQEQAQTALHDLNCSHPDISASGLSSLLERIGADSPDAVVIKRAIDWLEAIAVDITRVDDLLVEANFSFGKIEK